MYISEDDSIKKVDDYGDNLEDQIEGTYEWDYNILDVHYLIVRRFQYHKEKNINKIQQLLDQELDKSKSRQNLIDRRRTQKRIREYQEELDNITSDKDFKQYVARVKHLIEQYRKLGTINKVVTFGKPEEGNILEAPEDEITQFTRHRIISKYLDIAKDYIQIDVVRQINVDNICLACKTPLTDNVTMDKYGIVTCNTCGLERLPITISPFCKNSTRINTTKNNYEDRDNFYKVLQRFQGKQINKPPPELYIQLDEYFEHLGFPNSEEVKDLPINFEGAKDNTSRQLMYEALRKTGNAGQYDHINLICHIYWGWELPDISALEDKIMKDYDLSQKIYDSLPKNRKSSLNSQFRLYKHLRRLGYPCKEADFKIPSTQDIREFHEITWAKICQIAGWENI